MKVYTSETEMLKSVIEDLAEENAELREALRNIMAQLPRKPYFRHEVDEQARARKLLGADDDKPS